MGLLDHKAVVVTGAGDGLGRAYAHAVAAAGGAVVVNDVRSDGADRTVAQIQAAGGEAVSVVGSVADWAFGEHLVEEAMERWGHLDALINNAAITRHSPPWEESEEDLRAVVEVNVLGVQFMARHALRAMIRGRRGGSILNVMSGAFLGIPGMSSYGASKGAVASMTLSWATELRRHGIRVNALAPLARTAMALTDPRTDPPQLPDPQEMAPLVVALLSDEARDVDGRLIRFDGRVLGSYRTSLSSARPPADPWTHTALLDALRAVDAQPHATQMPPPVDRDPDARSRSTSDD